MADEAKVPKQRRSSRIARNMRRKNWWFPEDSLQWVEKLSKERRIPEQEVANWGITILRTLLESMPEERKEDLLNRAIDAIKQLPKEPPK